MYIYIYIYIYIYMYLQNIYTSLCSSTNIIMKAKKKCLPLLLQNILLVCLA